MKKCTLLLHQCVRNGVGISIKSLFKSNFKWLDREFKANECPMNIRGNTKFRFPLYDVLIVAGGIK